MVKKISGAGFSQAEASHVAVVDFSATWCGPCKMLAPVLDELSEEMAGKADFYQVDVDENPDLAVRFGISSIPAVLIMKDGVKADMQVGFQPKELIKGYITAQL